MGLQRARTHARELDENLVSDRKTSRSVKLRCKSPACLHERWRRVWRRFDGETATRVTKELALLHAHHASNKPTFPSVKQNSPPKSRRIANLTRGYFWLIIHFFSLKRRPCSTVSEPYLSVFFSTNLITPTNSRCSLRFPFSHFNQLLQTRSNAHKRRFGFAQIKHFHNQILPRLNHAFYFCPLHHEPRFSFSAHTAVYVSNHSVHLGWCFPVRALRQDLILHTSRLSLALCVSYCKHSV